VIEIISPVLDRNSMGSSSTRDEM